MGFRLRTPWYRQTNTIARKALERLVAAPLAEPAYFVGLDVSRAAAARFAEVRDSIAFTE